MVRHLATGVPGNLTDSLENSYIFSWDAHALLHQPLRLFDANIFFVNVATLALYAVGGYTTYLLVRELGASRGPGVVAGVAFLGAPYRVVVIQHLTVLATHLLPLAFLLLLRIEREVVVPTRRAPAGPSPRGRLPRLGRLAI
ncbi:MAG: hypothetical protein E6G66_17540, partial [Actinobacteria bacterium]